MEKKPDEAFGGIVIDPSSPVPISYQIYEALRAQLGTGRMPVGSRLSTERTIAGALGVSRQTVRQALGRLEQEGRLNRRQGDGTYVAEARLERALSVAGFTGALNTRGGRVRSSVLDLRLAVPPPSVAEELGVSSSGESTVMLRRVRSLDGIPATLETAYMPATLCAPLLEMNMTNRSLYATLEDLGIRPVHATERLSATALDDFEARQLAQRRGDPALLVERVTSDAEGRNFESVKEVLRADRFSYRTELDLASMPVVSIQPTTVLHGPPPATD